MSDTIRTREFFTADGTRKIGATILQTGRRLSEVMNIDTPRLDVHQRMAEDVAQSPVELLAAVPGGYTWKVRVMTDYSDYGVQYVTGKSYWAITYKGKQIGSAPSEEVARMVRRNHAKRAAREAGRADR